MIERMEKDFRDLFMVADEGYLFCDPVKNIATITLAKFTKVPGFGTQKVEKGFPIKCIFRYPENAKSCTTYLPNSVLRAIFFASSYGDKTHLYVERAEKDRHLYLVSMILIREYKGKDPMQIRVPLGIAKSDW